MAELTRDRLLARLDAPFLATIVEGVPGSGRRTLLRQWVAAARPADGHRAMVDLDSAQLSPAALWAHSLARLAAVGAPVDRDALALLARQPDDEDLLPLAVRALATLDGPATLVFPEWDLIQHAIMIPAAAELHRRVPHLAIVASTVDGGPLAAFASGHGAPFQRLTEDDLWFTTAEVATLLRLRCERLGLDARPEAADRLARATDGHPATVAAVLDSAPRLCADALVTRTQAVQSVDWTVAAPLFPSPPAPLGPLARRISAVVPAPRVPVAIARQVCPDLDVDRLRRARFGVLSTPPGGELTFVWDATVRHRIVEGLPDAVLRDACRALAASAESHGDHALAVVSHVRAGDLVAAESLAHARLWDLVGPADADLWNPLLGVPASRLVVAPSLGLLRELFVRRGVEPNPVDDARTAVLARRMAEHADPRPAPRLAALARSALVACEAGDLALADGAVDRWLELMDDTRHVLVDDPSTAIASSALLVGQVLVQLDRYEEARTVWRFVLEVLDGVGEDTRRWERDAHRGLLATGAVGGAPHLPMIGDPLEGVPLAAGRELDLVLVAVTRGWQALDEGRLQDAMVLTSHGLAAVRSVASWPVLVLVHLAALAATGGAAQTELLRRRVLDSPTWRARQLGPRRTGPLAEFLEVFSARIVGVAPRDLPEGAPAARDQRFSFVTAVVNLLGTAGEDVPGAAVPEPDVLAQLSLRMRGTVLQAAAVEATREEGGEAVALAALRRVYGEEGAGALAPMGLSLASSDQIERLCAAVEAAPDADLLAPALAARGYAGGPRSHVVRFRLSDRERELLGHIREARTNSVIAEIMSVSVNTVKFHRANLYRKLGAKTRDEALEAALRLEV
ncbi:hypothetical protein C8046_10080 [Serinibacter arcticus]|uniref:HTH luxR-type domain-containing protein n=1 Tax=Serinibacter arcticus TaxID=1655435 RepID=A0A2U1ZVI0_9MICO|nr:helix-turn-helix domain-containing protein [Serinibacter arcticus]PWD50950.1 hypothetical protein C8046_10080 [Serinibacter arcticus]